MKKKDRVTNESFMSDKVKTALLSGMMKLPDDKKLRCDIALREFKFRKGIYDVIGYNKRENAMYIVECKLGTDIISIGHAFGQIIAYKSMLTGRGYEFLMRFHTRYHEDVIKTKGYLRIQLEDWMKIIKRKKMNFRFFVAVKEQARKVYREIISVKKDVNFKIGVLMVTKDGVCTPRFGKGNEIDSKLAENDNVVIPLIKKYTKASFLETLEEKVKETLRAKYPRLKSHRDPYVVYFRLYPNTHYEVWVTRTQIEIALHIEASRHRTEKVFSYLKQRERQVKSSLGTHVKIEKWGEGWTTGKGNYYARVYERVPRKDFDEDFLTKVIARIKEYVDALQPLLEQI